jgi:hypothetical protein
MCAQRVEMSVVDVRLATVTSGHMVMRPEAAAVTVGGLLPLLLAELADLLCRRGQSDLVPELTRSKIVDWCECGTGRAQPDRRIRDLGRRDGAGPGGPAPLTDAAHRGP